MKIQQLVSRMKDESISQVIITDSNAIHYFTGFRYGVGERWHGLLVDSCGNMKMVVNKIFDIYPLEMEKVVYYDHQEVMKILSEQLVGDKIGIDKTMKSCFSWPLIQLNPEKSFVLTPAMDLVKAIKTEDEIEKMRVASKINDEVMQMVHDYIYVGMSEIELATYIKECFYAKGATLSFEPIVAFEDNGANPHANPSNRILKEKESVLVDMGCIYNGYASDMTRTFFVQENVHQKIYDIVLKANLEAIKCVKPNVSFASIDQAARSVIEEAGYGEYFTHRLGHGIGMECHEPFDVSGSNPMMIEEGMCFSIEPGIYIEGKIGIRIEDLVVVTKNGVEVLNSYTKIDNIV